MFCTGGIHVKSLFFNESKGLKIFIICKAAFKLYGKSAKGRFIVARRVFVFDDRVALNHNLEVGSYDMCHGCRMPITDADKHEVEYVRGVSCPNCFNKKTPEQKKRYADRQKQVDLAKLRNDIGASFRPSKK